MTTTPTIMNRRYGVRGAIHTGIAHAVVHYGVNGQHGLLNGTHGNLPAANRAFLLVERRASQLSDWLRQGFVIPIIRGCIPRTRHRLLDCKTSLTFLQIPQSPDNDDVALDELSSMIPFHQCPQEHWCNHCHHQDNSYYDLHNYVENYKAHGIQ